MIHILIANKTLVQIPVHWLVQTLQWYHTFNLHDGWYELVTHAAIYTTIDRTTEHVNIFLFVCPLLPLRFVTWEQMPYLQTTFLCLKFELCTKSFTFQFDWSIKLACGYATAILIFSPSSTTIHMDLPYYQWFHLAPGKCSSVFRVYLSKLG